MLAQHHGCEAIFVSGGSVALTQLALPDVGLNSASELVDLVARIADRVSIPVFVDGDSGYGNAANLQRLVRALGRAGASAIQIEDQLAVKPAAQLRSRPLISVSEMVGKIKAAQDARPSGDFLISARSDAMTTAGIDEALIRAEAYVAAGCDLLFVESMTRREDVDRLVREFGGEVPLVNNLLEGGGSPFASAKEAEAAGFSLALFPATALQASVQAMSNAFATIAGEGSSSKLQSSMTGMKAINAIIGADELVAQIACYDKD
jgi:2-methylisocitrate lyase-like PEP mutase family enzyme